MQMDNLSNQKEKGKPVSRIEYLFSEVFQAKTDSLLFQLLRYVVVGGVAFVVDFGLLFLLVNFLSVHYLIAAGISFISGLAVNYLLSISWVFNKDPNQLKSRNLFIFLITGLMGLGLNELLMYIFTHHIGFVYLISKVVTVPLVLLWNFFSRKYLLNRNGYAKK
jgi:putative flippase GtrA